MIDRSQTDKLVDWMIAVCGTTAEVTRILALPEMDFDRELTTRAVGYAMNKKRATAQASKQIAAFARAPAANARARRLSEFDIEMLDTLILRGDVAYTDRDDVLDLVARYLSNEYSEIVTVWRGGSYLLCVGLNPPPVKPPHSVKPHRLLAIWIDGRCVFRVGSPPNLDGFVVPTGKGLVVALGRDISKRTPSPDDFKDLLWA